MTDTSSASTVEVVDVPDETRFEARVEGVLAGIAEYGLADGLIVFVHTEVDPAFEGRGVAGALVRHSLDDVRERGLAVVANCPFYKGWIERHPEYQDLVVPPPESDVSE